MQISTTRRVAFTAPVVATAPLPIAPEDVVLRPPLKRRPTFTPETVNEPAVDSVETSCTESDCDPNDSIIASPPRRPRVPLSPVIPPRLVSLPSGGAISYMNSTDDVNALLAADDSSPSHGDSTIVDDDANNVETALADHYDNTDHDIRDTATNGINRNKSKVDESNDHNANNGGDENHDDGRTRSTRRLVRVDGSATLSAICEGDDDDGDGDDEDDAFQIEGAEDVEEEEAVPVRSFGRSFARVCLGDGASTTPVPVNNSTHLDQVSDADDVAAPINNSLTNEVPRDTLQTAPVGLENVDGVANVKTCEKDVDEVDFDADAGSLFDNSGGARRRSHFILPFPRRSSASTPRDTGPRRDISGGDNDHAPTSIMCFRGRRPTGYARSQDASTNDDEGRTRLLTGQESASRRRRRATNGSRTTNGSRASKGYSRLSRGNRLVHALSGREPETRARPPLPRRAPRASGASSCSRSRASIVGLGNSSSHARDQKREHGNAEKKIVRDVSLQRDDWIEFATSGGSQHRPHRWLARLVSSSGLDMSPRRHGDTEEGDESLGRTTSPYGILPMRPSDRNGNARTDNDSNDTHFSNTSKSTSKFWRRWTRSC